MSELRKVTVFEPCDSHAGLSASRRRLAEVMLEGGWASPCGARKCRMCPGTDFYTANFVAVNPIFIVGGDDALARECEACGAEAGEECRPDCIGAAAFADEQVGDVYEIDVPDELIARVIRQHMTPSV